MRQRIQVLTKEGHDAARKNCKILIDLFNRGKHGKHFNAMALSQR
jgi:hypothetical protein